MIKLATQQWNFLIVVNSPSDEKCNIVLCLELILELNRISKLISVNSRTISLVFYSTNISNFLINYH